MTDEEKVELPAQLSLSADMKRSMMLRPQSPEQEANLLDGATPAIADQNVDVLNAGSNVLPEPEQQGERSPAGSPDSAFESPHGSPHGVHGVQEGPSGRVTLEGELYDEYVLGETEESRTRLVTPPSARVRNIDGPSIRQGESPEAAELRRPSSGAGFATQPSEVPTVPLVRLRCRSDRSMPTRAVRAARAGAVSECVRACCQSNIIECHGTVGWNGPKHVVLQCSAAHGFGCSFSSRDLPRRKASKPTMPPEMAEMSRPNEQPRTLRCSLALSGPRAESHRSLRSSSSAPPIVSSRMSLRSFSAHSRQPMPNASTSLRIHSRTEEADICVEDRCMHLL